MPSVAESYDEMPYENGTLPWSHPERMATIGTLFGLNPADIRRARILELGCAHGGNLLPLAASMPQSEFIGIDLSGRQIEMGQQLVAEAGLTNVRLLQLDLMELDATFEPFDYIICHGLFSWVPAVVRTGILNLCTQLLRPQGMAFVSYNTFPGWHMRSVLGKMMRYHTRDIADPVAAVTESREFARFLSDAAPSGNAAYQATLQKEYELIRDVPSWYLHHDHLAGENQPLFFHEFAESLTEHKLQYVGEARFQTMFAENMDDDVAAQLQRYANDPIEYEQYLDYLSNRSFRESLICHSDLLVDRNVSTNRLEHLHAATSLKREQTTGDTAEFVHSDGRRLKCSSDATSQLLGRLADAWPGTVSVQSLLEAEGLPSELSGQDEGRLADFLLRGFATGMIELRTTPIRLPDQQQERPQTNAMNRVLAKSMGQVVSARHTTISLNDLNRRIVPLLDGSRDRAELARELCTQLEGIDMTIGDPSAKPVPATPALVKSLVDKQLNSLALQGVLQA
ncbi:methyltransferase regulatory domain-containing protein [Aporhodopirellula aestuarii]|uniref:Class I SAM-dependent methyltransferase n=1 Tax=Aporhodopirellula aestuarii TaxID=2950107 RepID=A0ABT0U003_9BACT|nr:class I SAM-dependent methyltransferase [Aporhodopirellula aestuarii]MCM2370146.1 class I SAM-dependent methyltransferase [Aporhodopirellula aestuarii]